MPRHDFGMFSIEIRTNEHNHKKQRAHVHIYAGNQEQGSMYLDGTIKDGCEGLNSKLRKMIARVIVSHADEYQEKWNSYQDSIY